MTQDKTIVIDQHIDDFEIDDLFLSRTDDRGIIRAGNMVFQRVSGFEWPELLGAPHKLVRHPDMPKSVFWFMWSELKAGRCFGGYVKNRSKCGRYYWVFAVALPIAGGYLSVRLKPSSDMLEHVTDVYRKILSAEARGTAPEEGFAILEEELRAAGYRDYRAFAAHAIGVEYAARCTALEREVDPSVAQFEEVSKLMLRLSDEVEQIKYLFNGIRNSPTNLNILGSRLSSGREPMQVVAQNYGILSDELFNTIGKIGDGLSERLDTAFMGQMGHSSSLLYQEVIQRFQVDEPNAGSRGHGEEARILLTALQQLVDAAEKGSAQIDREVRLFAEQTSRLRRMLSGLAMTRVICRIESASVTEDTNSIDEISARLTVFQDELGKALDRIASICDKLSNNIPDGLDHAGIDALTRAILDAEILDTNARMSA